MNSVFFIIGIICAVFAVCFFAAAVAMFFGFKIPTLVKDMRGTLEQKQIEEIRSKNSSAIRQRRKVNVFEELERNAKVKRGTTQSLGLNPSTYTRRKNNPSLESGTSVLNRSNKNINPNFVIEKNIVVVSTNEVI